MQTRQSKINIQKINAKSQKIQKSKLNIKKQKTQNRLIKF